ncbi:hypothetical protein P5673_021873 [Acropora cervicornis]|uniref:Uncharacterized protein n=1 Tax=Acropora cervicornis TaxID=6130 RepID=A0AAD9Q7L1_ACRCE|nr:hypothetical protein P5673_021873 [Acropora cervicornis]
MEGARHQTRIKDSAKSVPIAKSFASVKETSLVAPTTLTNDSVMERTGEGWAVQSLSDLCTLSKKVAHAEILWALKCVSSHFSRNSNTGVNDLFKRMFSDSEIAATYSMSGSKFRYVTTFGLGPYFAKKLLYDVKQAPAHALLFNESQNEEMASKQLDVHVCYWSSENVRVESRDLTSSFIGHGSTDDILKHFEEATKDLDPVKTWNIGPNSTNCSRVRQLDVKTIRWLENLPVAGKSLTLLSSMREYCRQAELEKTAPKKHEGYQYAAKAVTLDKLRKAKHYF